MLELLDDVHFCLIAYNLIENLAVNGIIRRVEISLDLFHKLLIEAWVILVILPFSFFILFNRVRLEFGYHSALVLLQVNFGEELAQAVDANELDDVRVFVKLLCGRLVFVKPLLLLLEESTVPAAARAEVSDEASESIVEIAVVVMPAV